MSNKSEKKSSSNVTYKEAVFSEEWKKHRGDDYRKYRERWVSYPEKRYVSDFPMHLDIETTSKCNLKCPMCPLTILDDELLDQDESMFMSREDYINIIDQGVSNGVSSLKLQYLGEPMLHKDLSWQIAYAKENGVVDIMFNTNATALTKENGKKILEAGIDNVFVSIDAISPDLYEEKRVGTSLGKVIDNVYTFVKLRNEGYPHVQIRISMVMYDDPVWKEQYEGLKIMWKRLVDNIGYGDFNQKEEKPDSGNVDGFVCEQLFQRMFLRLDGTVTVCCVDSDSEYVVGNWKEEGLKEIWNGDRYQHIRNMHVSNQYGKIDMCRKCWLPEIWQEETDQLNSND